MSRSYWRAEQDVALRTDSISEALAHAATTWPDRPAVVWPDDGVLADLTYAELEANAEALGRRLSLVCPRGEPVAVWAPSSADWLVLEYAAARLGAPLVPVNPALTDDEVEHALRSTGAAAVFTVAEFRGSPLVERARGLAAGLPTAPVVVELSRWFELPVSDEPVRTAGADALFLVQLTSGTTGRPKGALLTQRAALNSAALSVPRLDPGDHEVWCSPMPLHHVAGSVSVALANLVVGGTVVLLPSFDAASVLDLLERTRATILGAVPTMVIDVLDHPTLGARDLSSLRAVQIGGSTVPPALIARIERTLGVQVSNAYGQSEAPNAAQTRLGDGDVDKAETIGKVNAQHEARVVDPATGSTVPFGAVGELWLRSVAAMSGYLGEPEATTATLQPDGWLRTGDLVTMDERGVLRVVGRLRDVIIRGGENIYPAEVEAAVAAHPDVADVVVVAAADERWGEVPVGVVRPVPGTRPSADELETFARARLAAFKAPRRWVLVEEFPLTASGKIKRFELRATVGDAGGGR